MKYFIIFIMSLFLTIGCDDTTENVNNDAGTNNTTNNNNTNSHTAPDFMDYPAKVSSITDGDTIYVWYGNIKYKVRFLGVNTPETYGTVEPYGPEAKQFTIDHLPIASWVGLEFDNELCATQIPPPSSCFDMYDRLLAYIRTEEDQDLGAQLLINGLARVYTDATFNRKTQYLQLQDQAIAAGLNIWSK